MYFFGDSFDLYALPADALLGYWDSGNANATIVAGRFSGSRAFEYHPFSNGTIVLQKSSGSNDAVHHLSMAIYYNLALAGTSNALWFTLCDGATAQCSIVFRSDGAILLNSGAAGGTNLATYTGAIPTTGVWNQFEIEVVINNTTGSIAVRKNGNTVNDFAAGSLNTRGGTANNYANRLTTGSFASSLAQFLDDLLWRSDAASVPWVGDIRCYTRRPASDAAVQWSRSGSTPLPNGVTSANNISVASGTVKYMPFTAVADGTIGSVTTVFTTGSSANFKCAIYSSSGGLPTIALGSATPVSAPGTGTITFTFASPVSVTKDVSYFIALLADATSGVYGGNTSNTTGRSASGVTYSTFPLDNPTTTGGSTVVGAQAVLATSINAMMVAEAQQDAAASYVYSATVGQTDQYALSDTVSAPTTVVGVTTRGLFQKSDAGTRNAVVQLKSGGTTMESASTALNTTWSWIARTDLTDPATGAAWTPGGVSTAQVGARVAA
ncbi:MAG TPA: hypothetical protein VJ890_21155 [Vineibacter sp.]|nr:hypothetical protein [Vineibacter sp.]